jgi:PAS domain S-box-containing protein
MINVDRSQSNDGGNRSSEQDHNYERLRAWYLAHLRKSQLADEVAGDMTPATLIKRDREALELLIADDSALTPQTNLASERQPLKLNPAILIVFVNIIVASWFLFAPVIGLDFSVRLAIAILLVLSNLIINDSMRKANQSEVTLNAVSQREKDIADYAYEAFWSLDEDFEYVASNQAFERLTGNPSYLILGRSFLQAVPLYEQERFKQYLSQVKLSQKPQKYETQILQAGGALVDLELTAEYSSFDATYYCLALDITARKNVDRLKEQLMAMLSHDLKTPLASLQFALALLSSAKYGTLNEKGDELVHVSEKNVGRLISLINQMLDLHKLDSQQLTLALKDVPVAEIIQPALEAIESYAEEKQMEITINAEDFCVRADKERMHQVLINLLSNAIKYSPSGSEIVLSVKKLPGDWLAEFRVSDCGAGILPEHRQRVFDRFYRVTSEDGAEQEGTGLGLAICKIVVEAHGGKIDVESNSPQGSSFYCHIPMVKIKPA